MWHTCYNLIHTFIHAYCTSIHWTSIHTFLLPDVCAGEMALQTEDSVRSWSVKQVAEWLEAESFPDYVPLLCDQHRLDGPSLLSLTEGDLRTPPLQMTVLGDIKRLMLAVNRYSRTPSRAWAVARLDPE